MIPGTVQNQEILEKWCIEARKDNLFLPSDPHVQGQVIKVTITGGAVFLLLMFSKYVYIRV